MADKVVLAYSGGLDTTVAVPWIKERYGLDVVTLTIDIGQPKDWEAVRKKALASGAVKAIVRDAKELFLHSLVWPALQAGALYEGKYPLATALGRPLIAKLLVDVAHEEGAVAVAHGCTGKGNDQVRLDLGVAILDPALKVIAPVREWKMSREEEIAYAKERGLDVAEGRQGTYSTDENLWGRSIECGPLEDPWAEPPEDAFAWTRAPADAPAEPAEVAIEFERGVPVALDGKRLPPVQLVGKLNELAGAHGVGRIDHVENRLIGIKSRELYEAPAAVVLHEAHRELEDLTLSKDQIRFKALVAQHYADLIYNGLWFTAFHRDLRAFVVSTQAHVSGTIRVRLCKGRLTVTGRKSPYSLYDRQLATYDRGDRFDSSAALGFIYVHGLSARTQAAKQLQVEREPAADILLDGPASPPGSGERPAR
jgi:argininosuccinate synthase